MACGWSACVSGNKKPLILILDGISDLLITFGKTECSSVSRKQQQHQKQQSAAAAEAASSGNKKAYKQ